MASSTGVVSGCAVTLSSGMVLSVAAGVAQFQENQVTVLDQNVTLPTLTTARIDLICVDSTGTVKSVRGHGTTSRPAAPSGTVELALVFIAASASSILASNITDLRSFVQELPGINIQHWDITQFSAADMDRLATLDPRTLAAALVEQATVSASKIGGFDQGMNASAVADSTMSKVTISADLTVTADAGTSDVGNSAYNSSVQGNVVDNGDPLTKTHNYISGVHGLYSITNTTATVYPKGAVLGSIGTGSSTADGAFVAVLDGDATTTTAGAAFKVRSINTDGSSGFDFGLDLQDDGQLLIGDAIAYLKAAARYGSDVVELLGTGAPTDAVTGVGVAGPGSRYTDIASGFLYRNTTAKTSPTWSLSGVTLTDLAVTSTAAEINALHSQGAVTTDFAKLHAITAAAATLNQVAAAAGTVTFDRSLKIAKVPLAALDTGGGVFAWANPEAGSVVITKVVLDVTTKSTGACTLDIGTTAANATTLSDNLIDGVDVGAAAILTDNVTGAGTNGKSVLKLATGKWVTGSMASGAAAGLVGSAYISYMNV